MEKQILEELKKLTFGTDNIPGTTEKIAIELSDLNKTLREIAGTLENINNNICLK